MRLLGTLHGYYPKDDPLKGWEVDSLLGLYHDISDKFWFVLMSEPDEKFMTELENYTAKELPAYFDALTKRLSKNKSKQYVVGDGLTIADFVNAGFAYSYILNNECCMAESL